MSLKLAALLEPKEPRRRALAQGLAKAGLKLSRAHEPAGLTKEDLVVLGPTVPYPRRVAQQVREQLPGALVVGVLSKGFKAPWADAVVPLPLSPNDLKVRLWEWAAVRKASAAPVPPPRPGEGILDPLTNFYTFNHFKEVLFVEVKRARRYGFPLALALLAFDPLTSADDKELQPQLLGGLSLAIRRSLRDTDYPVQQGTDRVLLLMPHTDLAGALIVARRICERVARATLQHGDQVVNPTISIGVAAGDPAREYAFSDLVRQAQDGLASAQTRGGNRVEFFDTAAAQAQAQMTPAGGVPAVRR